MPTQVPPQGQCGPRLLLVIDVESRVAIQVNGQRDFDVSF
jgi:hypothetical protein